MNVLVVLSHNDDEYFVSARIEREVASGNPTYVIYTTFGSAYGTPVKTREHESLRVLRRLGVPEGHVASAGLVTGVFDGFAYRNLVRLRGACLSLFGDLVFGRVIAPAWEGGHPDHDATHLVAVALAGAWGLEDELYEFPLYTGAGAPGFLFRTGHWSDAGDPTSSSCLGALQRVRALMLFRFYRSQWKTFLPMLPETGVRYLLLGEQPLRKVGRTGAQYLKPPHAGRLYYETRFKVPYPAFMAESRPFIESELM